MDGVIAMGASATLLVLAMAAGWLLALRSGNGGWADTVWTFALGASALLGLFLTRGGPSGGAATEREILVAALIAAWSVRLGIYLWSRTRGSREDERYADLRREWGDRHPRMLFLFLQAQALAALPLVGAVLVAANRPGPLDLFDALGVLALLAGVSGSAIADLQLARFKANPANRGRVCDVGLWSLSRHPNYFFEWVSWWAWPLIAFDVTGSYPLGLLAIAAPALMYYLLVHVSGLPPLEAHMQRSRGAAFEAYKRRTPVFFPRLSGRTAGRTDSTENVP